jgi:hypothetical protein
MGAEARALRRSRVDAGREDLLIELCGGIDDEDQSLIERAEERGERFEEYSNKRSIELRKQLCNDVKSLSEITHRKMIWLETSVGSSREGDGVLSAASRAVTEARTSSMDGI